MWTFLLSFIWGSVGLSLAAYGHRRQEVFPVVIGITLMVCSYFLGAILMSIVGCGALVLYWMWLRGQL